MKHRNLHPAIAVLLVMICTVALLRYLGSVFLPLLIAFMLAFLFDPLVSPLERRGVRRPLAIIAIFLLLTVVSGLFATVLVSSISKEFQGVQGNLPAYAGRIYQVIPQQVKEYLDIETPEKVYLHANRALSDLRDVSLDILREAFVFVKKAFVSTLSFILALIGYFIIPIYLYYFMKDLPKIRDGALAFVPVSWRGRVGGAAAEINEVLSAFVRGQLAVCAILAVLYSIGLYFIGIDLAVVIGTTAGIAFIVPYLGTILGIIFSMIMAALKFQDLLHPLLCLGWFGFVQLLEGAVITPRIVGEKVGLHPVAVIVALLVGGELFGIFGMLLAVPVTAVLNVFSRALLDSYRKSTFFTAD